ncbi:MAG: hypothetical protein U5L09_17010 [Bacteroidales bacterium]|nr:hypothetical protein [Bacteroidales bacterium]
MKTLIPVFLALFITFSVNAQNYSRVEIDLSEVSLKTMASLGLPMDAGFIKEKNLFVGEFSEKELQRLEEHDLPYDVLISDLQEYYVSRNQGVSEEDIRQAAAVSDVPVPEGFNLGSMGGSLTYEEIFAERRLYVSAIPGVDHRKAAC